MCPASTHTCMRSPCTVTQYACMTAAVHRLSSSQPVLGLGAMSNERTRTPAGSNMTWMFRDRCGRQPSTSPLLSHFSHPSRHHLPRVPKSPLCTSHVNYTPFLSPPPPPPPHATMKSLRLTAVKADERSNCCVRLGDTRVTEAHAGRHLLPKLLAVPRPGDLVKVASHITLHTRQTQKKSIVAKGSCIKLNPRAWHACKERTWAPSPWLYLSAHG